MSDPLVHIQVDPTDSPSTPSWFGEVAVVAHAPQRYGTLTAFRSGCDVCEWSFTSQLPVDPLAVRDQTLP